MVIKGIVRNRLCALILLCGDVTCWLSGLLSAPASMGDVIQELSRSLSAPVKRAWVLGKRHRQLPYLPSFYFKPAYAIRYDK